MESKQNYMGKVSFALIWGMVFIMPLLISCSKYESPGSEFAYELKCARETTFRAGGKHESAYTIKELLINGNKIDLVNEVESSKKAFLINTKDYGQMKVKVTESKDGLEYGISLYMTKEQKEKIKFLGKK